MQGYILVDRKLVVSTDQHEIENAMPLIKEQLELRGQRLNAESTDKQLNEVLDDINHWLGIWNRNVEALSHASKLRAIADAKKIITELKWPPDEPPPAESSS